MTEMNFRKIPEPLYPEQEMADEPWYSVAEHDVFPEEFRHFLCNDPVIKNILKCTMLIYLVQNIGNLYKKKYVRVHSRCFAYPVKQRFCQRTF